MNTNKLKMFVKFDKAMANMNRLADESGALFASCVVFDLENTREVLREIITEFDKMDRATQIAFEGNKKGIIDYINMCDCLINFRNDLTANTIVGKHTSEKAKEMKVALNM